MKNCKAIGQQEQRNQQLLKTSHYMRDEVVSETLPLQLDLTSDAPLSVDQIAALTALEKEAASTSLASLASLAKIGELDHLGGGLELIPGLLMTLAVTDYQAKHFTIEHAHTSIGYYSSLAALGFLDKEVVIDAFRRGIDIAGHVSWVPGGTELNGGRLGVMVPVAVGQALGLKAHHGDQALVICHCGDAGWISGQALNGFNGAHLHGAPTMFVMHRNGIQLSGPTKNILDKDPRPMVAAMGIEIIEIPSLHDPVRLWEAYKQGFRLAQEGKPSMIYPTGEHMTLAAFGEQQGITDVLSQYAGEHGVTLDQEVWIPGSLMSWRDVISMIQCIFAVNDLPGAETHHDGHMQGRDLDEVLANPMLVSTEDEQQALQQLASAPARKVTTQARPAPGSANLVVPDEEAAAVSLPGVGKKDSPRTGTQAAYEMIARNYPQQFFNVGCDLSPSTKLDKAEAHLDAQHNFEMGIEEQVALLMASGLSTSSRNPQVNIMSTFACLF